MVVNLKNRHSPCMMCMLRTGTSFDPKSDRCKSCEYNILSILLAKLLKDGSHNYCTICRHLKKVGDSKWTCPVVTDKENFVCNHGERFELNWEAACKEYGIETVC